MEMKDNGSARTLGDRLTDNTVSSEPKTSRTEKGFHPIGIWIFACLAALALAIQIFRAVVLASLSGSLFHQLVEKNVHQDHFSAGRGTAVAAVALTIIYVTFLLFACADVLFCIFVLRRKKWARTAYLVLNAVGLIVSVIPLTIGREFGLLSIALICVVAASVVLLWTPAARRYFAV